jgi:uncharacterized protein
LKARLKLFNVGLIIFWIGFYVMKWGFYGRETEIKSLTQILSRGRFFFLKIEGRRRIGKTRLIREALVRLKRSDGAVYCKVPDSGVETLVDEWRASLEASGYPSEGVAGLRGFAQSIRDLIRQGVLIVLDEFQYLSRERLRDVLDSLQGVVDDLRSTEVPLQGGLIVLGSIATELDDLINDRHSPLFGRVTDQLKVDHWDISTLVELLESHPTSSTFEGGRAGRLLSLWNVFEGVPKFYQDAFDRGVLHASREEFIGELFLSQNAPLASEAELWFLRELRGNYAPILHYIAEHEGRSHADIVAHMENLGGRSSSGNKKQVGGYMQGLEERYEIVESRRPLLSSPAARKRKYYIKDRFLRAYLGAIGPAVKAVLLPFEKRLALATSRLNDLEGHSFERLYRKALMEAVTKQKAPFIIDSPNEIGGYWSKMGEVDLLATDKQAKVLWAVSCKRRAASHGAADLQNARAVAQDFLAQNPSLGIAKINIMSASPAFSAADRSRLKSLGSVPISLEDLCWG